MIGGLWAFVKRHRRKFVFLGSFVGGSWLLYKYIWKKIQEIRDEEDKQYLILVRRQHHFDSNQRTCNMTVLAMVSNVREILTKTLDTESIKEMLKSNPQNKLDLWEELKVMSVTRTLASVYGTCILSVMLRVQLNVVGGYLYLDSVHPTNGHKVESGHSAQIPQRVQERYLSLVKQFIEQGFLDFINYLRLAVMKEIGSLPLKELMSLDQLTSVFDHIRERVECGVDKPTQSLYPYLLTSEQVPDIAKTTVQNSEDELLEKLIAETRDILESNDFHTVLKGSIDRGYHCILDGVADHYKQQSASTEHPSGIHEISIALAKLVPVINSLMYSICGDAPNPFIQELLLMEELKQLAANVYEAFSQDPSEKPSI
ncbi:peroxisomal biogenesis factor 3 [Aplysia californica]|uniref:Peroxisomal biogenesis factor 3 n=1 Tax=Aplysia californica TaxID=6500 RepID=A0ABM0JMF4_APLCA|nr:peroxisomal biogenesis factor 3 [Aplysia californica]